MTIRDTLGTLVIPGTVPTGRLVWVDAVSGNDSVAARGRLTVPFRTLTAAKNAAASGDTIIVMPGTYAEAGLLKHQVNWFFLPGAIVNFSGTGSIFDTGSAAVTSYIGGHGEFIHGSANGYVLDVTSASSSSDLVIEAKRIQATSTAIRMGGASSKLRLQVVQDITSANTVFTIAASGSNTIARAHTVETTGVGAYAIYVNDGSLDLSAHRVASAGLSSIMVTGGVGDTIIKAYEIAAANAAVSYNASSGYPKLTILGARIKSSTSYAIEFLTNPGTTSAYVKLSACLLLSSGTNKSIFITSPSTAKVQLSSPCVANNIATSSLITLVPSSASAWIVDTTGLS